MYGKLFESTYTGSMFGAGANVFAVWTYVIAHVKPDGYVEINSHLVAAVLGMEVEEVDGAIQYLSLPDSRSRGPEHDGRRLVREAEFIYQVPQAAKYRSIRSDEERRAYNRERKRAERSRKSTMSNGQSLTVNETSQPVPKMSVSTDTESYADTDKNVATLRHEDVSLPSDVLWEKGVKYLMKHGSKERAARSVLGRWLKDQPPETVLDAFRAAQQANTGDPVAYISKALSNVSTRADGSAAWTLAAWLASDSSTASERATEPINAAVKTIGGWRKIGQANEFQMNELKRRFLEAYASTNGKGSGVASHAGELRQASDG